MIRRILFYCLTSIFFITQFSCKKDEITSLNVISSTPYVKQGGTGFITYRAARTDQQGNLYITGYFNYTVTFGSITVTQTGNIGNPDMFLAKYNSNGLLEWVKTSSSVMAEYATNLEIDKEGNVYVIGIYSEEGKFDNFTFNSTNYYRLDSFIVKYNKEGQIKWAKNITGNTLENLNGVGIDNTGNVYVTGYFFSRLYSNGQTVFSTNGDDADIFIIKYNESGMQQWIRTFGGAGDDTGNGIVSDNSGNMYFTGSYSQSATFGNHSLNKGDYYNTVTGKIQSNGNIEWVRGITGSLTVRGITSDKDGNSYVQGTYGEVIKLGNTTYSSEKSGNIYIAKYNSIGELQWGKSTLPSFFYVLIMNCLYKEPSA